jgi:hypothetical protein
MTAKINLKSLVVGIALGAIVMFFAQISVWQFMFFSNDIDNARRDLLLTQQADLWNQGKSREANDIVVSILLAGYENYKRLVLTWKGSDQEAMQNTVEAIDAYIAKWPSSKCVSEPEEKRLTCELGKKEARLNKSLNDLEKKFDKQ